MNGSEPRSRRSFLDALLALCGAIAGAALAWPALAYLWPAARGGGTTNTEVPGGAALAVGSSATVQVGSTAVIVVRTRTGLRAFSASCTHLGCLVSWSRERGEFLCPCHAAVFDEKGRVVSGPPPAPLVEYTVREVGDKVLVSAPA